MSLVSTRTLSVQSFLLAGFLVLAALATTGCGTMSKSQCAKANWEQIGFADGLDGKPADYVNDHVHTCGSLVEKANYERGRLAGVKQFCLPHNAYSAGAAGKTYLNSCPDEMQEAFYKSYGEGQKTYGLVLKREAAEMDLRERREKIDKDNTVWGDVKKVHALISGYSQTEREERRVEDLDDQVHKQMLSAPAGSVAPEAGDLSSQRLATALGGAQTMVPIAGIIAGSTVGFGVGHAVTGLYGTRGWKWTVIDAVNVGGFFAIGPSCFTTTKERGANGETIYRSETKQTGECQAGVLFLVGGVIASRVIQGIEIGRHGFKPYQVSIAPNAEGGATAFASYSW